MSSVIVILYAKDFVINETNEFKLISFYDISLNSYSFNDIGFLYLCDATISTKADSLGCKICYNLSDIMSFKMWNRDTLPKSKRGRFDGEATKKNKDQRWKNRSTESKDSFNGKWRLKITKQREN